MLLPAALGRALAFGLLAALALAALTVLSAGSRFDTAGGWWFDERVLDLTDPLTRAGLISDLTRTAGQLWFWAVVATAGLLALPAFRYAARVALYRVLVLLGTRFPFFVGLAFVVFGFLQDHTHGRPAGDVAIGGGLLLAASAFIAARLAPRLRPGRFQAAPHKPPVVKVMVPRPRKAGDTAAKLAALPAPLREMVAEGIDRVAEEEAATNPESRSGG